MKSKKAYLLFIDRPYEYTELIIGLINSESNMTQFGKNILVSTALASSDFISFIISMYFAIGILIGPLDVNIIDIQANGWLLLHSIIGIGCIAWYSMRLRHYFYRKTFWFELKEILRTLVIFSFIEIAIVAFATGHFHIIYGFLRGPLLLFWYRHLEC